MELLLISIGGALGASLRYALGQLLRASSFPWATLVVNVLGSWLLGLILFGTSNEDLALLIGTGFCGAFTTFSSFSYQTVELWERGRETEAVFNGFANLLLSLAGYGLAWLLVA